jgi:hypothetical protein
MHNADLASSEASLCLLLHMWVCRWLLLRREAGGIEQRQKHVNVLMYGEQQLTAAADSSS